MITNTMLMKFKDRNPETIANVKEMLLGMKGEIDPLLDVQIMENKRPGPYSYDLMLVTEFASMEEFEEYLVHPVHVKVAEFVTSQLESAASVCFES